jgi:hypothetical protein
VVAVDLVDYHREEPVQQVDHLRRRSTRHQLCGPDDVDENHRDMAFLAAQLGALLLSRRGHLTSDVSAEEVPYPFAFTKTGDHRVEATLQLAEFAAVEHHHVAVQVALLDVFEGSAHHAHWRCRQPGQDPHQQEADE